MDNTRLEKATQLAQDFLNFANKGVSPYHVVHESTQRLQKAGFTQIHETENWDLEKGGRYFFIRSESSLVAFIVGNEFDANNTGFKVIGAHTDSPCLRLAPLSASSSHNFHQTCVCTYGGGLWHTWFDRDLILAGRVVYKDDQDQLKTGLYNSESAILKVPNLAIHLTSIDERNKFAPNLENHLKPILASQIYEKLSGKTVETINGPLGKSHYEGLLQHIQKKVEFLLKKQSIQIYVLQIVNKDKQLDQIKNLQVLLDQIIYFLHGLLFWLQLILNIILEILLMLI
ncbi:hypothetical protein IMG5_027160 [Ichthyophthirius multifiliis]|uniref:aspartyl aminopeptidase n=1 Tax=Ichthyophthirius multifiliis TaxID=5932 RepID=G0QL89_ICHMU|nr:hypothetical protein IMG5_027160 [Ichthyophthirius multifiliis]EGR34018.1 hypothetical protein IMG5_027160 [Ichthyophthirius multifiliis]|eukprot:XP_004039322.1 hypothetical protein IMG5_027160 [Ichthyophthirius multifiliis]